MSQTNKDYEYLVVHKKTFLKALNSLTDYYNEMLEHYDAVKHFSDEISSDDLKEMRSQIVFLSKVCSELETSMMGSKDEKDTEKDN